MLEATRFLQYREYIKCADSSQLQAICYNASTKFQSLHEAIANQDCASFSKTHAKICVDLNQVHFCEDFARYLNDRCSLDENFKYYNTYCEKVEVLVDSIRTDRITKVDLHLQTTRKMLPFLFAMNHHLYARGVTQHLQDRINLLENVRRELQKGMMSVKRK